MSLFDRTLEGRRIQLEYTNSGDLWTKLTRGDKGTIQYSFNNLGEIVVQVKWDSGSNLGLILGKDKFRILPLEKKKEEFEELLK